MRDPRNHPCGFPKASKTCSRTGLGSRSGDLAKSCVQRNVLLCNYFPFELQGIETPKPNNWGLLVTASGLSDSTGLYRCSSLFVSRFRLLSIKQRKPRKKHRKKCSPCPTHRKVPTFVRFLVSGNYCLLGTFQRLPQAQKQHSKTMQTPKGRRKHTPRVPHFGCSDKCRKNIVTLPGYGTVQYCRGREVWCKHQER